MENEIIVNWVTYVKKEDNQKKQSKRGDRFWGFSWYDGTIFSRWTSFANISIAPDIIKPFNHATEAEAIKARDKQLALYRIKTYAEEKRGEFVPNWDNVNQAKYFIYYNADEEKYDIDYEYHRYFVNQIYIVKEEHCEEIIEKFKDDLDILFDRKWDQ